MFIFQCFATGTAGFVLASLAVTMIVKGEISIPSVAIKQTVASLAYRLEFESDSVVGSSSSNPFSSESASDFEIISS